MSYKECFNNLHREITYRHYEHIEQMLKDGFDPNCKDHYGQTPFHHVCHKGDKKIIDLFLRYGGDPFIKHYKDATPYDLADREGKEIIDDYFGENIKEPDCN